MISCFLLLATKKRAYGGTKSRQRSHSEEQKKSEKKN